MITYVDQHRHRRALQRTSATTTEGAHGVVEKIMETAVGTATMADHLDDDLLSYLGEWFKTHIGQGRSQTRRGVPGQRALGRATE